MPIYQTVVMILWICTGLVIFDEARFYSTLELLGIFGSIGLCCVGCGFLMVKTKKHKKPSAQKVVPKKKKKIRRAKSLPTVAEN